ncbi:hypothetical protein CKA32_000371 [Geitlerinema sp. FC II]|nr:hypothetical protein CKA32_000371 [Geitlerinema sp. FC II]
MLDFNIRSEYNRKQSKAAVAGSAIASFARTIKNSLNR